MEEEAAGVVGGVRVVARICPPAAAPTSATVFDSFQVTATRGGSHPRSADAAALLSFTAAPHSSPSSPQGRAPSQRKEEHKLDWCYLKDETNHHIFLNEVKPLVHHLLGGSGTTSCVVTCGAATSKDHLFMGSRDQPGLVAMAMEQILKFSKTVKVSSYEVLQEIHVFDLLEPKDHEVLILEDSDRRTHLKGLSKVQVKSFDDFINLCTKSTTHLHSRGHQGMIIHISNDQEGKECVASKINFLSMTGYVDPKQNNKSMYALMNVMQALNSNQSFIPYRQSKVTRILQDSLCKTSGAVLITYLDEFSCQDTVSTLNLVARSSKVANEQLCRSSKTTNVNLSGNAKNSSTTFRPSVHKPNPAVEKHGRPQWNNSAVKACPTPIANNRSQPIMHSAKKSERSLSTMKIKQKDAKPTSSGSILLCPTSNSSKEDEIVAAVKEVKDYSSSDLHTVSSCTDFDEACSSNVSDEFVEKTPVNANKHSPKISDRLREISNNLKLLSARPLRITTQKVGMEDIQPVNTDVPVAKTPVMDLKYMQAETPSNSSNARNTGIKKSLVQENIDVLEIKTPVMQLKYEQGENPINSIKARSADIKKSLVQEFLTFLNSANKEELKTLKGIGERRADCIIELRENSPELFKEMGDLKAHIGMNQTEIKKMLSSFIDS